MDEHRCREDREHRGDLLLSTLANYLRATGATDPRIVVTAGGHDVEPLAHAASTTVTAESQLWGGVCSGRVHASPVSQPSLPFLAVGRCL